MGRTQCGQHTDGGLDDIPQGKHLAGLTDASLEDTHLCLLVQEPHTEGNAYLGVVASGRTHNFLRGQQQLIKPLLYHRLTVRACDTHDGHVKLVTMALGQSL